MRARFASFAALAFAFACSPPTQQTPPPATAPHPPVGEVAPASADLNVAGWRNASGPARLAFFSEQIARHFANAPVRNDAQLQFDQALTRDLYNCVLGEADKAAEDAPIRPIIDACLAAAGMAPAP